MMKSEGEEMAKYYRDQQADNNVYENPIVEEPKAPAKKTIVEEKLEGVVSNCERLNIRKDASTNAEIVNVVDKGEVLDVKKIPETPEWVKVKAKSAKTWNYAMGAFIDIKK